MAFFTSVADMKRKLVVGARVRITNHHFPNMSRDTTVLTASSSSFSTALPDCHPNRVHGSFCAWPKSQYFDAPTGTLFDEVRKNGMTLTEKSLTLELLTDDAPTPAL